MAHIIGDVSTSSRAQIDKSLTVSGMAADAKVTGEHIAELYIEMEHQIEHSENMENPHKVTAKQLGLEKVDNTSDMDKPISTAQKEAIDIAKNAADKAQSTADNAQNTADDAKTAAQNAQSTADTALSTADTANSAAGNAHGRADEAYTLASTKSEVNYQTLTLNQSGWGNNAMNVIIRNLEEKDLIFLSPQPESRDEYLRCGVYGDTVVGQTLRLKCKEVPTETLKVECCFIKNAYNNGLIL